MQMSRRAANSSSSSALGYLRSGQAKYLTAGAFVANLGFIDRVKAVIQGRELVPLATGPQPSFDDTGALLKIRLRKGCLQGGSGVSIATELGAILPTLGEEPGAGYSAALILSQQWSFATVHLNVQGAETRARNADVFVGTIVEGPDAWTARPVAEIFFEDEFGADRTVSGLVGFIARASDQLSFDMGTRVAWEGLSSVFELRAGLTWGFPIWGRHEDANLAGPSPGYTTARMLESGHERLIGRTIAGKFVVEALLGGGRDGSGVPRAPGRARKNRRHQGSASRES
jgi:hypothetical protein